MQPFLDFLKLHSQPANGLDVGFRSPSPVGLEKAGEKALDVTLQLGQTSLHLLLCRIERLLVIRRAFLLGDFVLLLPNQRTAFSTWRDPLAPSEPPIPHFQLFH